MSEVRAAPIDWQDIQRPLWIALGAGAILCALGAVINLEQFFRSYLIAFLFWFGIALGGLAILMLQNLVDGRWGRVLRRPLEAAVRTLPLLALLFVPIGLGVYYLYPWAGPIPAEDHLLQEKSAYLNVPFFLVRAVVFFGAWIGVAFLLLYYSGAQENGYDVRLSQRARQFTGPGLVLYGLAITFAGIDWVMSLDPHWHSSIFGVIVAVSQILLAMAFGILVLTWLARRTALADLMTPELWHDLGNLLLAFTLIWTYVSFSQFLIIWSGNLPEEITWYKNRIAGGWEWLAWVIIVFSFAVPFLALLMRDVKRNPGRLAWVALLVLVMGFVHHIWLVKPAFGTHAASDHGHATGDSHEAWPLAWVWLDAAALCALGGLWLLVFLKLLTSRSLLPRPEPLWQEGPSHG